MTQENGYSYYYKIRINIGGQEQNKQKNTIKKCRN